MQAVFVVTFSSHSELILCVIGAFRHFAENPSCQHVLLACCHDNGYVRMLEKCAHNPAAVKKVTMIRSFQTGGEFDGLPFRTTTMDTVFRARPIVPGVELVTPDQTNPPANGLPGPAATGFSSNSSTTSKQVSPQATYASRAAGPQLAATPSPASGLRRIPEWGTLDKTIILINNAGHRIDMTLPATSTAVVRAFYRKMHVGDKRFCNKFHLGGACPGNCGYLHDPLTAGEKLVKRHKLRTEACHDQGGCRDPVCFYGHHCACPGMGKKCNFPPAMHGVDVTSWRTVNTALV